MPLKATKKLSSNSKNTCNCKCVIQFVMSLVPQNKKMTNTLPKPNKQTKSRKKQKERVHARLGVACTFCVRRVHTSSFFPTPGEGFVCCNPPMSKRAASSKVLKAAHPALRLFHLPMSRRNIHRSLTPLATLPAFGHRPCPKPTARSPQRVDDEALYELGLRDAVAGDDVLALVRPVTLRPRVLARANSILAEEPVPASTTHSSSGILSLKKLSRRTRRRRSLRAKAREIVLPTSHHCTISRYACGFSAPWNLSSTRFRDV